MARSRSAIILAAKPIPLPRAQWALAASLVTPGMKAYHPSYNRLWAERRSLRAPIAAY